jgi:hypothetical protein
MPLSSLNVGLPVQLPAVVSHEAVAQLNFLPESVDAPVFLLSMLGSKP